MGKLKLWLRLKETDVSQQSMMQVETQNTSQKKEDLNCKKKGLKG